MKTPKTYRLSERTLEALEKLKELWPERKETEIVEQAIQELLWREEKRQKERRGQMKTPKTYRLSERTLEALEKLKELWPERKETEIVEQAIQELLWREEKC